MPAPSREAWRRDRPAPSLPEAHRTVAVRPASSSAPRRFLAFAGPGCLVAVGYMDPGNWATDLAAGSRYGYTLLSVVVLSSLMAMLLQHLCVKLGVATGRDLAQSCRDHYPIPVVWFLFLGCELAIAACDLAEVVGSAIGLQLLFGIPLLWGCAITAFDVLVILLLQHKGFRWLEALVVVLIATIGGCFAVEIALAKPSLIGMLLGLAPSPAILHDPEMLYMAIGILGATVMPHNLYLHSSLVQTRDYPRTPEGRREAIRFATLDSNIALTFAFFISAAILVLAAAAFHEGGRYNVAELQQAYKLLDGALGVGFASILFGVALLASGQNSTLTGTLAGQIVMQGFVNLRMPAWASRLMTRSIAIVPAVLVIGFHGEKETTNLIVASQVVLSMQLGFAVWPLMRFTSDRAKMGEFVNPPWVKITGWTIALVIIGLNAKLVVDWMRGA